jgi:hypothetical protein
MLSVRTGGSERRKETRDMNAFAVLVVNEHMEFLLAEAAANRLAKTIQKPSLRDRIASVAGSVRSAFTAPVDSTSTVLPKLEDSAYRS